MNVLSRHLVTIALLFIPVASASRFSADVVPADSRQDAPTAQGAAPANHGFEVWIADQSDTRPGFGGQILVYEGAHLYRAHADTIQPIARLDLGGAVADLCVAATGRRPVRPHMILFNTEHSHAVVSFVASGHVVVLNADTRAPLVCIETTVGSTGTRQAHAAFPAPDGSYILVANQNGKRLERIDADFAANRFVHNPAATLDLAPARRRAASRASILICVRSIGRSARSSMRRAPMVSSRFEAAGSSWSTQEPHR